MVYGMTEFADAHRPPLFAGQALLPATTDATGVFFSGLTLGSSLQARAPGGGGHYTVGTSSHKHQPVVQCADSAHVFLFKHYHCHQLIVNLGRVFVSGCHHYGKGAAFAPGDHDGATLGHGVEHAGQARERAPQRLPGRCHAAVS